MPARALPFLLVLVASPVLAAGALPEVRGLWVVRTALVSPDAVDRVVDEAREGGLTDLFVQVRGRGDAFYGSRIVGRSPLLAGQPASFDPLARLVERARARGLRVHAWVNVLLTAHFGVGLPADHVVRRHPEWLMVPRSAAALALSSPPASLLQVVEQAGRSAGEAEGYYISPSAAGVPEHLEAVVRELVRAYRPDGLHLDFIRYPSAEYDYSRAALEQFRRRQGGSGDLLGGPARQGQAWDDYRREALTALARRLVEAARGEVPGMVLSAAVVADEAQARNHKFQDWPRWADQGLLEAVCPMAYTADRRIFRAQVEQARARVPEGRALWAGIGAYRLDLAGLVERIQLARDSGASGVVLFSHESLSGPDWKRLRQEAFPLAAAASDSRGGAAGAP
ncbi:MAG TPA: family 10 glycosylhydrolase [Vicinamibacteria bacterium]|nr:family 10 glycosylhydrolase [Vicinamibacteria bacterium]